MTDKQIMDKVVEAMELGRKHGKSDEYHRIIGYMKWHRLCIVDNNGDYYSPEEFEEMLKEQK